MTVHFDSDKAKEVKKEIVDCWKMSSLESVIVINAWLETLECSLKRSIIIN